MKNITLEDCQHATIMYINRSPSGTFAERREKVLQLLKQLNAYRISKVTGIGSHKVSYLYPNQYKTFYNTLKTF